MRGRAGSPGDLEITIRGAGDLQNAAPLLLKSYERSQETVSG